MYENFELVLSTGKTMKGCKWLKKDNKKNLVIVTGMAESSYRYDEFALFLNSKGYDVYCIDHYGQGLNCETEQELGVWPKDGFRCAVELVHEEVEYVKTLTKKPVYLFGHSMGSFVSQEFIQLYGNTVEKAIICGSNGKMAATGIGGVVANFRCATHNRDTYKDKLLNKIMFSTYNNKIKNPKTEFDWLSTNDDSNQKYIADFRCGYVCTPGFYSEFMKGLNRIHKTKNVKKVPADLPILLVAGKEDPVGGYGKGVLNKHKQYLKLKKNSHVILYDVMRHEIINEIGREKVYEDIAEFLNK